MTNSNPTLKDTGFLSDKHIKKAVEDSMADQREMMDTGLRELIVSVLWGKNYSDLLKSERPVVNKLIKAILNLYVSKSEIEKAVLQGKISELISLNSGRGGEGSFWWNDGVTGTITDRIIELRNQLKELK